MMQSANKTIIFGCFKKEADWTNIGAIGILDDNLAPTFAGNAKFYKIPGINNTSLGAGASFVPAAMTVQVMNPEALQTTTGICYMGAMNLVPKLSNTTRTGKELAEEFISFNKPRLCAAAKLALAGVECHLPPMNMSDLSDFTVNSPGTSGDSTDFTGFWSPDLDAGGFAPFIMHNPSGVNLQYLITVEYRLRFDIAHPAASTHTYRPPASIDKWHRVIETMVAAGHGVREIAALASSFGAAAGMLR